MINFDQKYLLKKNNRPFTIDYLPKPRRNFKNIFSRPNFTINFRPEMTKFHAYSILTGDKMVGFVIFCVLMLIRKSKEQLWRP